jgi:hypothetical protein
MMNNLIERAEARAQAAQRRKIAEVAARLREIIRGASIEVEEARILVRGKGLVKRWLIDPSLRFLSGGLK